MIWIFNILATIVIGGMVIYAVLYFLWAFIRLIISIFLDKKIIYPKI